MFLSNSKVHYDHFTNYCKIDIGNIIAGWIPTKGIRNTGKYKKKTLTWKYFGCTRNALEKHILLETSMKEDSSIKQKITFGGKIKLQY